MIGLVVATHGNLAAELLRTAEAVVGPLDRALPVAVVATAPDMRRTIADAIRSVDEGEGVVLLTDLLGGSPTNLCVSFLSERKVEVVTGVNLAMVLKLASLRAAGRPIAEIAQGLVDAGQRSIRHASELVRRTAAQ